MIAMNAATGRRMPLLDHLRQSVRDILTTPLGSRLCRRDYGSEIPELIDQPLHGATILRLYAATAYRLAQWEPRLTLTAVHLQRDTTGALSLVLQGVADDMAVELDVPVRDGDTA